MLVFVLVSHLEENINFFLICNCGLSVDKDHYMYKEFDNETDRGRGSDDYNDDGQ